MLESVVFLNTNTGGRLDYQPLFGNGGRAPSPKARNEDRTQRRKSSLPVRPKWNYLDKVNENRGLNLDYSILTLPSFSVTVLIWINVWVFSLERGPNRYHPLKGRLVYTCLINFYYVVLFVRDHLLPWILVNFSDIMNHKARPAWELYLKMETSGESFSLLQLIANDCYKVSCKIR